MTQGALADLLEARLPSVRPVGQRIEGDVEVVVVEARQLVELARFLARDRDAAYDLVDLTAIDRGPVAARRFLLLVIVVSRTHQSRARLEVEIDDDHGAFPSLHGIWPAALIYEREVIDLLGLIADGHPQPQRLLLPEGFVGHPLRVDHPIGRAQPQVPATTSTPERLGGTST